MPSALVRLVIVFDPLLGADGGELPDHFVVDGFRGDDRQRAGEGSVGAGAGQDLEVHEGRGLHVHGGRSDDAARAVGVGGDGVVRVCPRR